MPKYVLNRNFTLVTLSGRAVEFVKGKETHVPKECVRDAIAIGALPADGTATDSVFEESNLPKAPTDPQERLEAITAVVRDLIVRNDRDDFTAAGLPNTRVVSKILGWRVDTKEVHAVWTNLGEEQIAAREQAELDNRLGA